MLQAEPHYLAENGGADDTAPYRRGLIEYDQGHDSRVIGRREADERSHVGRTISFPSHDGLGSGSRLSRNPVVLNRGSGSGPAWRDDLLHDLRQLLAGITRYDLLAEAAQAHVDDSLTGDFCLQEVRVDPPPTVCDRSGHRCQLQRCSPVSYTHLRAHETRHDL